MKIGIMSDSHGQENAVKIAVEKMGAVDLWIHCGDHDKDSLLLRTGAVKEVIAVQGNCDYHSYYKVDEFIEIAGKKIWITHGHQYKIKNSKLVELENVGHSPHIEVFDRFIVPLLEFVH